LFHSAFSKVFEKTIWGRVFHLLGMARVVLQSRSGPVLGKLFIGPPVPRAGYPDLPGVP
jgi:hypothetical protein